MRTDPKTYFHILQSAFAKHYCEGSDEWTHDREMRSMPALLQGRLKLDSGTSVLDIGCGTGEDAEFFAQIYQCVVGLDIHQSQRWKTIVQRRKNIEFICIDFLSFHSPRHFDLIFDSGCFHHQHPDQYLYYLKKIASCMSEHSYFVLSTFKANQSKICVDCHGRVHKYFLDKELEVLLGKAGLSIMETFDIFRKKKGDFYRLTFARLGLEKRRKI